MIKYKKKEENPKPNSTNKKIKGKVNNNLTLNLY